jgi:SP family facilitated glucose transporter-like MFS transporter 1
VINASQQFSGINAVSFYSSIMFENAGLKDNWPIYFSVIIAFVQIIMSFFTTVFIDRLGRKTITLLSLFGMCISCFSLAAFAIISEKTGIKELNYVVVSFVVLYKCFFDAGVGSIPGLITVELFDAASRGKAVSIAVFSNL